MNFRAFVMKHPKHLRACFTVCWFLKGRVHLTDLFAYSRLVRQEELAENIKRNNALHKKLAKTRAVVKYLPPS